MTDHLQSGQAHAIAESDSVMRAFLRLRDEHYAKMGRYPTHCTIALALARRAVVEHRASLRPEPMFQFWDPHVQFIVLPCPTEPDLLEVYHVSPQATA